MTRFRIVFAWVLIVVSLVAWPITIVKTDEPPFTLSLSWLAITLTAYDVLTTSGVRNKQENGDE